jgi:hypothetical protein
MEGASRGAFGRQRVIIWGLSAWVRLEYRDFAAAKIAHLSDDETVAMMGHPATRLGSEVGFPQSKARPGYSNQEQDILGRERMILDWPNLLVGAILGFFAHWAFVSGEKVLALRKLRRTYGPLAGEYVNFRVKENGAEEATGGTIRLSWQPDGSFKALGLHANGVAEWESTVHISLKSGTWLGEYHDLGSYINHGIQQLTYLENAQLFSVLTTTTSLVNRPPFIHRWRRKGTS